MVDKDVLCGMDVGRSKQILERETSSIDWPKPHHVNMTVTTVTTQKPCDLIGFATSKGPPTIASSGYHEILPLNRV